MSALALVVLSACAAAGAGGGVEPSRPAMGTMTIDLRIPIPVNAAMRHRMYVSAGTNGIGISYGASPASFPSATTPTQAFDVSGTSTLCHTVSSTKQCTLTLPALIGTDDFQITAWSAAPSNGSFASAKMLSNATLYNQTVTRGVANHESVVLDGIVNRILLGVSSGFTAELPGSSTETASISAYAYDAAGYRIIGSYYDSSGNPVSVTVAQAATVSGDTLRTSVQNGSLSSSSSTLSLTYSGGGSWGTTLTPTASETLSGGVSGTSVSITPSTTNYSVPTTTSGTTFLAQGSDGNMWFTETDVAKVGKITTSGTITEYVLPSPSASPWPDAIAAGHDGNLWFTEFMKGAIGKITTSGTVTEYPLPSASSYPYGIVSGPDGNLWFTENRGNKVGKITTSGTITEYAVGPSTGANYQPEVIASGPDGNLWFTEEGNDAVCKITTSGTYTCYTLPTSNAWPLWIVSGSDGNLWLGEFQGLKLAKVTTSGTITEYSDCCAYYMLAGPDGHIWFQDNGTAIYNTSGSLYSTISPGGFMANGSNGVVWMAGTTNQITRYIY